jgi:hypothetical protein
VSGTPKKLPVLTVVRQTYELVLRNPATFLALCAGAAAISTAAQALAPRLLIFLASLPAALVSPLMYVTIALPFVVISAVGIVVAVRWHRLALLNEPVTKGVLPRWRALRTYGLRAVVVYGAFAAYLWIMAKLISRPMRFMQVEDQPSSVVGLHALMLTGIALGWLVLGRVAIAFPADAVGDSRFNFIVAWLRTEGSSWRMLGAWLLCMLPIEGSRQLYALSGLPGISDPVGTGFVGMSVTFAGVLVTTGLMSFAYRHFADGLPPSED